MRKILEERIQQRKEYQKALFVQLEDAIQLQDVDQIKRLSDHLHGNEERLRELIQIYNECRFEWNNKLIVLWKG